jgi:hypothetical protein
MMPAEYIEFILIAWISGWCNYFHKKHHQEAPQIGARWCWKCRCHFYYPNRR